jgi:hypothetical protein
MTEQFEEFQSRIDDLINAAEEMGRQDVQGMLLIVKGASLDYEHNTRSLFAVMAEWARTKLEPF